MNSTTPITVYGADWCEDTQATRAVLDRLGVAYRYVNVDQDKQAEALIQSKNKGKRQTPTLDIDGEYLIEPDDAEVEAALQQRSR